MQLDPKTVRMDTAWPLKVWASKSWTIASALFYREKSVQGQPGFKGSGQSLAHKE